MHSRLLLKRLHLAPRNFFSQVPAKRGEVKYNTEWVQAIEKGAYLDYKPYPSHLPHNDPKSKEYVYSERDEYNQKTQNQAYNDVVKHLKNDLEFQKKVYDTLETMERPYLNGVPGVHKNVFPDGPRNVNPPSRLGFQNVHEPEPEELDVISKNQDKWLNQTVFYPKYAQMTHYDVNWLKEIEARPVTRDFHPDKGYKYDVPVPVNEKWPHVADRMGYPEILGDPWERLLRLESDIYHPNFLDQPFIQIPSANPHPSLNFEEGEVIYENQQVAEWAKFWTASGFSVFAFLGVFVPYSLFYKTHLFMSNAMDNVFLTYHGFSMYYFDSLGLHIPVLAGAAAYLLYGSFNLVHNTLRDYVVKMQYSKDRELIFVTRLTPYGSTEEEVYETAHLEVLPPSVKAGLQHMSFLDNDGIWDVTCMNTQKTLALYNENKYWNPKEKNEFFQKTLGLWRDYAEPITHNEIADREAEEMLAEQGTTHKQIS